MLDVINAQGAQVIALQERVTQLESALALMASQVKGETVTVPVANGAGIESVSWDTDGESVTFKISRK